MNGSCEWFLQINESSKGQLAHALYEKASAIENVESELLKIEKRAETTETKKSYRNAVGGHYLQHELRNRRFIVSQLRLKLNRLQEEYAALIKKWRKFK